MQKNFITGVENLVNPIEVGTIHFIQPLEQLLPKKIQDEMMKTSAKNFPMMGFVVEPYSTYVCYEITDLEKAKRMLPDGFELIKSKVFEDDEPRYLCMLGCFTAHTSAFWGTRIEFYLIAENISTGMMSWIIIDYDTNTISYDKKSGLRPPNSHAVLTTDHQKNVIVNVEQFDKSRQISFVSNIKNATSSTLDKRLWVEGNLSIGYGRELGLGNANVFSLKFNPEEILQALKVPLVDFKLENNSWFRSICASEPYQIVCFDHALHFLSDSPNANSNLKNEKELVEAVNNLDFDKIKVFSTGGLSKLFIALPVFLTIIILILTILLIF